MRRIVLLFFIFFFGALKHCVTIEEAARHLTNQEEGASYIDRVTSRFFSKIPRVPGKFWTIYGPSVNGIMGTQMILRQLSIKTEEEISVFEEEFRLNQELAAERIVSKIQICFYDPEKDFGYFVLPYLPYNLGVHDCLTLQQCYYQRFVVFSPLQRLEIYSKIADKLATLHESGRVHGNIRPEKIHFSDQFNDPIFEFWVSEPTLPEPKSGSVLEDPYLTNNQIIEFFDLDTLVCLRKMIKSTQDWVPCLPPSPASDIYAFLITIHKIEMYVNWRSPDLIYSELNFRKIPQTEYFTKIRSEALSYANYWRSSILLCVASRSGHDCVHRILAQMGTFQRQNRFISARRIAEVFAKFKDYDGEFMGPDIEASEGFGNAVNDHLVPVLYDRLLE